MRTVTFADPRVVDLLNGRFVAVWNNHRVDRTAKGEQAFYSREEMAAYPEGGGGNNLYTLVAAPDGTVLNCLRGYWSADTLLAELEFSRGLTAENRIERQAARVRALQAEEQKLAVDHPAEAAKRPRDSAVARRRAALNLLALTHTPESLAIPGIETMLVSIADRSRTRVFV